ncbi:hypothetical protein C8F01DRAFT_1154390 [Mycena amicta]|nr:hypothetical protein C8F01DRAFT_1154390 [Mycena amicta]
MSKEELGTLVIVVLKAKNLNDKYFWKQDVFAQVSLNGDKKQTRVDVKGGQNPEWDQEIRFPIYKDTHEKYRKLEVSCWAKEPRKEENIGAGLVDLAETLRTGEFDDWVNLESSGVMRGEVYLEMTFFANAPAPAGHGLSVPKANLQRRQSKLLPADRLSRPSEVLPLVNQQQHGRHPSQSPPASKQPSPSPPRHGRESPLPPVPEQHPAVPGALMAGRPRPQASAQNLAPAAAALTPHVPSILRPRNPKSSPTPIPGPRVEYSGVVPAPEPDYESESPPRAYTPVVPPADTPFGWGSNDNAAPSNFSFPVPNIPGAQQPLSTPYNPPTTYTPSPPNGSGPSTPAPSFNNQPPSYPPQTQPPPLQHQSSYPPPSQPLYQAQTPPSYPPQTQPAYSPPIQPPYQQQHPPAFQQPPFQPPPPSFTPAPPGAYPPSQSHPPANGQDLPDPYLLKRYQSPLPLPPGSKNESHHHQRTTSHSQPTAAPAPARKHTPSPPPKHPQQQSKPTPASQANPDNARVQALRQVEEDAARRRAQEKAEEDAARRRVQEKAEEDAARRRAQEKAEEDAARRRVQEKVEEDAARRRAQEKRDREYALKQAEAEDIRKAQEERDLELARQLDRELNLGVAS